MSKKKGAVKRTLVSLGIQRRPNRLRHAQKLKPNLAPKLRKPKALRGRI